MTTDDTDGHGSKPGLNHEVRQGHEEIAERKIGSSAGPLLNNLRASAKSADPTLFAISCSAEIWITCDERMSAQDLGQKNIELIFGRLLGRIYFLLLISP